MVALATPAEAAPTRLTSGLRVHLGHQRAQVFFGDLGSDAKPLDGTVFSEGQNLLAIHDGGARARPAAVNSKHCFAHCPRTAPLIAVLFPCYWFSAGLGGISPPPSRSVPANTFRLPSVLGGVRPSMWAIHG